MLEKIEILALSSALARHASARQSVIAGNIANADTPGYRARDITPFEDVYGAEDGTAMRQTRAGHAMAAEPGGTPEAIVRPDQSALSPNGNSVSLEDEMVASADVRREHDLAIAVYGKALDILRAGLGRR